MILQFTAKRGGPALEYLLFKYNPKKTKEKMVEGGYYKVTRLTGVELMFERLRNLMWDYVGEIHAEMPDYTKEQVRQYIMIDAGLYEEIYKREVFEGKWIYTSEKRPYSWAGDGSTGKTKYEELSVLAKKMFSWGMKVFPETTSRYAEEYNEKYGRELI